MRLHVLSHKTQELDDSDDDKAKPKAKPAAQRRKVSVSLSSVRECLSKRSKTQEEAKQVEAKQWMWVHP